MNKKVLIITYYWPPAGGPGVQRVLKFVKYLPQFGWEPIVLTVKNGEYPAIDHSLEKDIPAGIKVYKTRTIEPFRIFKFLSGKSKEQQIATFILDQQKQSLSDKIFAWIRSNVFLPDARIGWFPFAYMKAKKIIRSEAIDIVFTSSPPHSLQLIGLRLKKYLKVKWVADFRDPWVDAFWEAGEKRTIFSENIIHKQEKRVFEKADKVVTVTESFRKKFLDKYSSKEILYIPNGFDQEDFETECGKSSDNFVIRYFGSIAPSQIPINFFYWLKNTKQSNLIVEFYGTFDQKIVQAVANLKNVNIRLLSYINHDIVIKKMKNANLLLLLIPEGRGDIVPGKLYEYIGSKTKILSLGPKGEANQIIEKYKLGRSFSFQEQLPPDLPGDINNRGQESVNHFFFERKNQTKILSDIFENLVL